MTKQIVNPDFKEWYEYHGNTTIERTRRRADNTIFRDWIIFDSVEEAADYFNASCCSLEA